MVNWFKYKFLTPKTFYATSTSFLPWLTGAFIVLFFYGLFTGLFIVPADYQQGDGFRIMYVHVPSAFAGMGIYFVMAISAMLTLVWRIKIAAICMACSAPIGAWFTFLALVTGAIWGKPMWGTWWIWDARLTSMLILLFLYLGFIALRSVITDTQRDRASSLIALVGAINLPIIHYSVVWWNTLHQASSFNLFSAPAIAPVMLYPLLSAIAAFFLFYFIILIIRMQNEILLREIKTEWVKKVILS
ncbi:MAG: heme transporter permease [Gammaproteobacteria bacterium]|jgi:heme exporter protein C|nr:heme transporter permease [Gammaproteobacteria bacterium]